MNRFQDIVMQLAEALAEEIAKMSDDDDLNYVEASSVVDGLVIYLGVRRPTDADLEHDENNPT